MAHRRSFGRGRGISETQRRKKAWFSVKFPIAAQVLDSLFQTSIRMVTPATTASAGSTTLDVLGAVDAGSGTDEGDEFSTLPEECTILRARGSLLFPKNTAGAGATDVADQYAFGFGVTDIRTIVNATVPGPIVDTDWDGWMFLRQSALPPVEANSGIVDVKAMRKIKTGDAFFLAAQAVNGNASVTPLGQFQFDLRLLILLP